MHTWDTPLYGQTDEILNFAVSPIFAIFAEASSLAGLEDIDDKLEAMEKMTPEEADAAQRWMGWGTDFLGRF